MLSFKADAAELGIAAALFSSIAEEMGVTLGRSAHSPNIKERRDYSCAVFDPQGRLVAQAAHIPVHLGAMPTAVEAAMPLAPFATGDIVILNDPYLGGTHLPDITTVSPVFVRRTRAALAAVPQREYQFEDFLDDDGTSEEPVPIRVRLTVGAGTLHSDFSGSAPERPSSVNAVAAVTRSAVYYVVRCLLEALVEGG